MKKCGTEITSASLLSAGMKIVLKWQSAWRLAGQITALMIMMFVKFLLLILYDSSVEPLYSVKCILSV